MCLSEGRSNGLFWESKSYFRASNRYERDRVWFHVLSGLSNKKPPAGCRETFRPALRMRLKQDRFSGFGAFIGPNARLELRKYRGLDLIYALVGPNARLELGDGLGRNDRLVRTCC